MAENISKSGVDSITPAISCNRGRLKIYLGFAPGVGKTYTMLREALYLKKQQYDVVIGWLEENYRKDTMELARELESVAPLEIVYKENSFNEMDVEGIIKRNPYLVLVDELPHTNLPGTLREKRYQDIEYILDHGINVMTTLNINHVEGVKGAATKITGTSVRETVPDWVLDKADEVELIDVSPQVVHQRLKEGKIFSPEMVNQNTYGLFSSNKLLALRELALRYVADEVDDRLESYRQRKGIFNGVHLNERILVCVKSPNTASRLIAIGARMARRMMGELLVLYIQVDCRLSDREEDYEILSEFELNDLTLEFHRLTGEQGGKFILARVCHKSNIDRGITEVIKEKKITQVVIGESGLPRWKEICNGSLITRILSQIRNVDIFVAGNREKLHINSNHNDVKATAGPNKIKAGKLKIYIGASAGVGKSVAMLREAHQLRSSGVDIAIGLIETHNRKETQEYIGDLEVIPLQTVIYREKPMKELDIKAIIDRKPEVVLIDELAHTNVPGTKNKKRYEDIQEILAAGIDVITAVNIQHIESLNDVVSDVTGVQIRETVPDAVIARADELVIIDVTPENLRSRLRNGKLYASEKIEQSLNSFFRKENLQALRELALRELALDIDEENKISSDDTKNIIENVLVCVQAKNNNDRLIRRGFKIAQRFKGKFYVLHIRDGHRYTMEESQQLDLLKGLAERLGASFNICNAKNKRKIKDVMLENIDSYKITKLILGQSARTRWEEVTQGSIVNALLSRTKGIDILILADPFSKINRKF